MKIETITASPEESYRFGRDLSLKGKWRFFRYGDIIAKNVAEDPGFSLAAAYQWPERRLKKHGLPIIQSIAKNGERIVDVGRELSDKLFAKYGAALAYGMIHHDSASAVQAGAEWSNERFNEHSRTITDQASGHLISVGEQWSWERMQCFSQAILEWFTNDSSRANAAGARWNDDNWSWFAEDIASGVARSFIEVRTAGESWPLERFARFADKFGQILSRSPVDCSIAAIEWDDQRYELLEDVILQSLGDSPISAFDTGDQISNARFERGAERIAAGLDAERAFLVGRRWNHERSLKVKEILLAKIVKDYQMAQGAINDWPEILFEEVGLDLAVAIKNHPNYRSSDFCSHQGELIHNVVGSFHMENYYKRISKGLRRQWLSLSREFGIDNMLKIRARKVKYAIPAINLCREYGAVDDFFLKVNSNRDYEQLVDNMQYSNPNYRMARVHFALLLPSLDQLSDSDFEVAADAFQYAKLKGAEDRFFHGLTNVVEKGKSVDQWASCIVDHFGSLGIGGGNYRFMAGEVV